MVEKAAESDESLMELFFSNDSLIGRGDQKRYCKRHTDTGYVPGFLRIS